MRVFGPEAAALPLDAPEARSSATEALAIVDKLVPNLASLKNGKTHPFTTYLSPF
jgi:hypothetical protein